MNRTLHATQRMSQRGISREMLETAINFGIQKNERFKLNRKDANKAITKLQGAIKCLKKIADKGGITVVASNDTYITSWNNY